MRSRQQYMSGQCTHEEYYEQFVTESIMQAVENRIGKERIGTSCDPNFNDIPLNMWDDLYPLISGVSERKLRSAGDGVSLAGCVCIAKRAAARIRGEYAKQERD